MNYEIRMLNDELPIGWAQSKIGNLCSLKNGRAFKPTEWTTSGLPIVRIQNLNNPKSTYNYFAGEPEPRYHLLGGELLFAWSGTPGTSFGAHVWRGSEAVLNQHIFRVDFDAENMDKRFFRYAINQKLDELIDVAHGGVGLRHVTKGTFEGTEIKVPPLAEQKRIADKLEAVLGRVDACRARLDRVPALLKRFRQSVLAAATSGKLTEEWRITNEVNDGWEKVPLEDTIDGIEQGWSPKCENEPSTDLADWAVIKTTAIQEMAFLDYENKRLPKHLKPRPNLEIQPGDILITRAGPRVRAAVTCMVDSVRPRLIVCDKVYRFRARKGKTTPNYLNVFLNSPLIVQELDEMKTGISDSGVNLTQSKFRALQIPLPTLPEQQEIVRRVEDLFAFADRIEARLATAQKTVERLTPATLAKAFRGELVPQDPNDEPASALLERLKSQPLRKAHIIKRKSRS